MLSHEDARARQIPLAVISQRTRRLGSFSRQEVETVVRAKNSKGLRSEVRSSNLHLVLPQILVVKALKPFAEVLVRDAVRQAGGKFGGFQHDIFDKDWTIDAQRQR